MMPQGFFYSPEDESTAAQIARRQALAQAMMEQGSQDPGKGAYGGLRSAGNSILGAILANKFDKQQQDFATQTQKLRTDALVNLLSGKTGTAQISNAPQQLDPEGNPMAQGQGPGYQAQPQQPQSFAERLAASGDSGLIQQFAPQIIQSQLDRDNTLWERGLGMTQADKERIAAEDESTKKRLAFQNQLPMNAAQIAADARARAQEAETRRHNLAEEGIARNPFGISAIPGQAGLPTTGDDFLRALPPGVAAQVKAIADYRQPAPASRSKQSMALMAAVNQYKPDYDATQYGAKNKARLDFTTGKNGNTVRSLNVAVQHLDQLAQLSDAMANGNVQAVNRIGNWFASQTGNPAPSNFNAARQLVGDEIVKAIVGAGGGVADREEAAHNISAASSPAQLAGVIKTYQGLLAGQLVGLRQQYKKSTGLDDFEDFLAPETRAKLEGHGMVQQPATVGGGNGRVQPTITAEQAAAELARRRAQKK